MPLYEYKCSKCKTVFEELVGSFSNVSRPCPSCGSTDTEKLMSAAGFISKNAPSTAPCPSAPACAASGSPCCSSGSCPLN